jgi:hypothetical protein
MGKGDAKIERIPYRAILCCAMIAHEPNMLLGLCVPDVWDFPGGGQCGR